MNQGMRQISRYYTARVIEAARLRGTRLLPLCVKKLNQILMDPNATNPELLRAIEIACDRFGLPVQRNVDIALTTTMFTPELMQQALSVAMQQVAADPSKGAVEVTDAEFEVMPPAEGAAH